MGRLISKPSVRPFAASVLAAIATIAYAPQSAVADESGKSMWLPGIYGSLAAAPQQPGWALATFNYYTSVDAGGALGGAVQVSRGGLTANVSGTLSANLNANADMQFLIPSYVFATPVAGGQLAVSMMGLYGRSSTAVDASFVGTVGGFGITKSGSIADSVTAFGDLYPQATLRWNAGVNNYMTYITGDIPVGAYDPNRLSNVGLGHGAIDAGAGYTYLNPKTGRELSVVGGFTYNLKNPDTQYQSGVDFHLDGALSQFLSKQLFVGIVGYTYQQLTADSGGLPILGAFKSRVSGAGPQIGYLFPVGNMQGYLNLKGYKEFDAANRPEGWNAWLTFSISQAAPPAAARTPPQLVYK